MPAPSTAVTAGSRPLSWERPAHNDESIDEQGITAGSIPATAIQMAVMGNEKVRSTRTPAVLSSLW
ncbi:TPA: hypothetical protein ACNFRT_002168 [Citrobacter freundii]